MNFEKLYDRVIVNESKANGDPNRFIGTGPAGFRRATGISPENVHTYHNPNPTPSDSGLNIQIQNYKLIQFALMVAIADTRAGMALKSTLESYGHLHFSYVNSKQEAEECHTRMGRLQSKPNFNPDSILYQHLAERNKKYVAHAEEAKEHLDGEMSMFTHKINTIFFNAGQHFAEIVQEHQGQKYKSLEDLDKLLGIIRGEDQMAVITFLKDIFRGETEFKPWMELVKVQQEEGRDPMFTLSTMYKTAVHISKENNLVGNPMATFNFITGQAKQITQIREPTVGHVAMRAKDPALAHAIHCIKKRKYEEAIAAIDQSNLPQEARDAIVNGISAVQAGTMTEADLIRPLYER